MKVSGHEQKFPKVMGGRSYRLPGGSGAGGPLLPRDTAKGVFTQLVNNLRKTAIAFYITYEWIVDGLRNLRNLRKPGIYVLRNLLINYRGQ